MYFPDSNPILKGLNTYYIKTDKLIEHFQGEIGNGVIYFKGSISEGAVFFESDHYLKSFFKKKDELIFDNEALSLIMKNCEKNNYEIYIYYLKPDEVYLWSEITMSFPVSLNVEFNSKTFNKKLQEFINLQGTGYFITKSEKNIYGVFFAYGKIAGYLVNGEIFVKDLKENKRFIKDISKIIDKNQAKTDIYIKNSGFSKNSKLNPRLPSKQTIETMGEFIFIFDNFISNNKKIKSEFLPMLKKKFIEYVDEYDFLDPFAAEFLYSDGKIQFTGIADETKFVEGIFKCIIEIALETEHLNKMEDLYTNWSKKNQKFIKKYKLSFN
ncbi:MAG: hypothetical protein RBR53_07735 [Desulforegulaceae bacterium]|nr:hypothetical protein [Desulforegulaceae bacterium]